MYGQSDGIINEITDRLGACRGGCALGSGGFPETFGDFAGGGAVEEGALERAELVVEGAVERGDGEGVGLQLEEEGEDEGSLDVDDDAETVVV